MSNRKTGDKGEKLAMEHLLAKGFIHRESNWRYDRCEIDLIMEDKGTLVFVEVKARSTDAFGFPEHAVKKSKQRNIIKVAEEYLYRNNLDTETRFDIVSIIFLPGKTDIFHIEDAFIP